MQRRMILTALAGAVLAGSRAMTDARDAHAAPQPAIPAALLPPALASWDFSSADPWRSTVNEATIPALRQGPGSSVRIVVDPHFGRVARFNGVSDFLTVPAADLGALDFARYGDQVTILAWVRRASGAPPP